MCQPQQFALWAKCTEVWYEVYSLAVDHYFARMLEVHGYARPHNRLDLTKAPIFLPRVPYQHSRFKHPAHFHPAHSGSEMSDTPDYSALIASRICHDLISPIGAIGNGVELLTMEPGGASRPEFSLIAASVANANARIRLFRIAFGSAALDQRIARNEVLSILTDLGHIGRITFAWTSQSDLARPEVRLVFLLLLCLETALPFGGRVEVTQSDDGWVIRAGAQRTKLDPPLWSMLTDPAARVPIEAGQVQFALVGREVTRLGRNLLVEIDTTGLTLTV